MCVPIMANLHELISSRTQFNELNQWAIYAYIYFSIALIAFYSYMAYFTVNPQIN